MSRQVKVDQAALKEVLTAMISPGPHCAELCVVHNLNKTLGGGHPNGLSTLMENWDDPSNHFDDDDDEDVSEDTETEEQHPV